MQPQAVELPRFGGGLTELELLILFDALHDWVLKNNITRTQKDLAEQMRVELCENHKHKRFSRR